MKTIKELACEALDCQSACNLSGVVHSFSRAMTELREISRREGWENTDQLNTHPIAVMYASKIGSLTGSENLAFFGRSLEKCYKLAQRER